MFSADACLKVLRLSTGSRRPSGSEFQADGPATAKHRRPKLFRIRTSYNSAEITVYNTITADKYTGTESIDTS